MNFLGIERQVSNSRILLLLGMTLILSGWPFGSTQAQEKVTTVPHVDLPRYMGTWYEIASIPMWFQRKCTGNTAAEYALMPNKTVRVINSCDTARGRDSAKGRARVVDKSSNAKLKVSFVNIGPFDLFAGDYWIIDLHEEDYRYAVVGHPTRKYGWILSRTPGMDKGALTNISQRLARKGYDLCAFQTTPQTGGASTSQPLCEAIK